MFSSGLSRISGTLVLLAAFGCGASTRKAAADAGATEVNAASVDAGPRGPDPACDHGPVIGCIDRAGPIDGGGRPWDWIGVVGTGQSLAVGDHGRPLKSKTQPYGNLKLSTGTLPWPIDPDDPILAMLPLTEPVGRPAPTYPSAWPENISGETMHSAMGNQISALALAAARRDYVSVQGEVGENGQCMTYLRKGAEMRGVNGRAYEATLVETQAITRLAAAAGKTYGVGAITIVHGECDAGNSYYEDDLVQLWADYNADLRAITGQAEAIPMLVSQQNSTDDRSASTLAQWQVGVDHPGDFVCVGPKYQYPSDDGTHLTTDGYRQLGEKFGQVFFERVALGRDWQPLQPTSIERQGRVISVRFHVPVPPLVWDEALQLPHQTSSTEWALGKGFEIRAGGQNITIGSVEIRGDTVEIVVTEDLPVADATLSYALHGETMPRSIPATGTRRWGLLRDSDPFVGGGTQLAQPNYAVAFELPVP
jgi:lysophospholipase L1-like esterase